MTAMSRSVKSVILYSAIAIAAGVGIIFIVYNQTLGTMFQPSTDEASDSGNGGGGGGGSVPSLGYLTHYNATLPVGVEGTYDAHSKFGKAPYTFEWKFSDGLTLTGQNVTRSFELPGRYSFYLTVTDGNGDKVTSTELFTNVVQEIPRKEVAANVTSTQHN